MSALQGTAIDFDDFTAYISRPEGVPVGGLVLIHEIWGLVDHIKDIADRFAGVGYLVIAPDILSRSGITPQVGAELERLRHSGTEEERTRIQPLLREKSAPARDPEYAAWAVGALRKVVDWLDAQPGVDGRIAATGFCFGGSYTFALAGADARVRVAAPFYGAAPETLDPGAIRAVVRGFYGRNDPRIVDALPEVEQRLRAADVDFEATIYEDAGHAFFNDTNPIAYRADAAADAWRRVNELFRRVLG